MAYGRHAQGYGRHRKPPKPPAWYRLLLLVIVFGLLGVFAPVVIGLGLAFGVVLGWIAKGITRT